MLLHTLLYISQCSVCLLTANNVYSGGDANTFASCLQQFNFFTITFLFLTFFSFSGKCQLNLKIFKRVT